MLVAAALAALSGAGCGSSGSGGDGGMGGSGGSTGGPCSAWSDWQCSPFGGGCNATCPADDSRDVLCNPSGSCIFKTDATSNSSCQDGMPVSAGPDCGFCQAAVAAGCY